MIVLIFQRIIQLNKAPMHKFLMGLSLSLYSVKNFLHSITRLGISSKGSLLKIRWCDDRTRLYSLGPDLIIYSCLYNNYSNTDVSRKWLIYNNNSNSYSNSNNNNGTTHTTNILDPVCAQLKDKIRTNVRFGQLYQLCDDATWLCFQFFHFLTIWSFRFCQV